VKLSGVCVVHLQDNSEQTIVNGIQSDDDSTYNLHMVIVDGTPAVNAHCVTETLLILFISHYIFNLHYPKHFNLFLHCPVIICGPDEKKPPPKLTSFYAPQLYRQVLLWRVLAMAILSVCLSVTIRCRTKPR